MASVSLIPKFARDEVLAEQLKLVTGSYLASTAGFLTVCAVIAYITFSETNDARAIVWFCVLAVIYAAWIIRELAQGAAPDRGPRAQATKEVVKVLIANVVFCYLPITFISNAYPPLVVVSIAIAAGGLSAGSAAMQSPCLPVFYAYVLPKMITVIVLLFSLEGSVYSTLAWATLLFLFLIVWFTLKSERNMQDSIELRFENRELVKQLRTSLTKTDEANNAKSVFLASASHDLRQPLHALALMTEVLGGMKLDQRQSELQQRMLSAVNSTRSMLDSLLDISKLEAGAISAKVKPFLIQTVFDKLDAEMQQLADDKNLSYRACQTEEVANSDALIVELIIRNLISNALRYTNQGGVLLTCRYRKPNRLLIQIWDTGIGIADSEKRTIFKAFHQLDNPERNAQKGFGLGLAITQGLAETIGSAITVRSIKGRGSVFGFELAAADRPVIHETKQTPNQLTFSGKTVLVIDDDAKVRVSMQELISSWNCTCVISDSAADALSQINDNSIDIMLVDYRLGNNLTGLDAVKEIRQHLSAQIPAVIITGDTAAEKIKEILEADAKLMHKPVSVDHLKSEMISLLAK